MSVFGKVLRAGEGKKVRNLSSIVPLVNAVEEEVQQMSDDELAHMTVAFRERLDQGEDLNDLLVEAFAVVREAARRVIGQRHFDVQLMGGAALHFGWIAEMRTGEGKTLVSTLPVYLNALEGKGVHVVTVNDYLASRDSAWMGQIYNFLGLSVGLVVPTITDQQEKKAAYQADITYGTNSEFGFDYLRDNMAQDVDAIFQRGHHYAIIDEVDSILIDEARTPLIISGPSDQSTRLYYQFASVVRSLDKDKDYDVDEEKRVVIPTEDGIVKVERLLGVKNLYDEVSVDYVHQLTKALEAKELYRRDKDYIVTKGEVQIVDEFTGRVLEGRRWHDGLHQAVEAKERVRIKEENHTWATVTLQNYFRMYEKLGGMTGTAETEAGEFASTYELQVVPIPTNRPMIREDRPDVIYKTEIGKFEAAIKDIAKRYEKGQPVLVGTASVEKSEELSGLLEKKGIPHNVLNAKQHAREAQVVAQAGRLHAVTVATNMAGRGVDILLGGNPEGLAANELVSENLDISTAEGVARYRELLAKYEEMCAAEAEEVRKLGGLYVLGSERHESRRIDNQLRGRSGRQGDPGESRFYLSLEDELMRIFASSAMSWVIDKALPEDVPIEAKLVSRAIEKAQNTVEQKNAEIRKDVLKYDEVMNEQRKVIYGKRMKVLQGEDLREYTVNVIEAVLPKIVRNYVPNDYVEEWKLETMLTEISAYYPTEFVPEDFEEALSAEQVVESILAEAIQYYEDHENEFPDGQETARQVERQILLHVIDQNWKQHLVEMDYLREGIHLRGLAQTDPLVAWQREGFEMFGKLMDVIDDSYLRFVMHVKVEVKENTTDFSQATFVAQENPQQSMADVNDNLARAFPTQNGVMGETPTADAGKLFARQTSETALSKNAVPSKTAMSPAASAPAQSHKTPGRNEPCWCGSGRKYKLCHGAAS
ncbi:MAG: preprotein translocase subunit SecA [Firmicutes bacterium]|nr:preprotein translocase subunit SecA [Bacillota bacterium]